jgi:hypothetical protein
VLTSFPSNLNNCPSDSAESTLSSATRIRRRLDEPTGSTATVGWVDVDPTHSEFVGNDHLTTALGRDYHDVPPNRGLWKGRAEESISVTVKVEPVDRVPIEWNEWATPVYRPAGGGQYQRQGNASSTRGKSRSRPAYPNQPGLRAGLLNQQSEQQQQQQQPWSAVAGALDPIRARPRAFSPAAR